ncbi:UNVERIFIED_CONTAM: Retrovirus-related Pol polyprotein from transposon RE1 [Sesamum latifolium]|uniref:Retrovirus-related Pol polyprotein from transposon RE1 n=1 Tax=Sesamum latifolium TaxID=2727402 RepID=A0AAW2TDN6_9LAMI
MKLGYISGNNPKPAEDSEEYEQWVRTDSLVISWLLNTISKEIVESFLYIDTARELWLEIEARYGVSNGPLVYQLQREIASASQGTLSVSAYFAKLKKLWDELGCLRKTPSCSCGALKELALMKETDHLMQFLMGLNDTFEGIRGQILMLEPLPTVTKAYATILREERQREVSSTLSSSLQNVAMQKKKTGNSSNRVLNVAEIAQNTLDEQAVAEIIRGEFQKFMEGVAPGTFERTRSDEFEDFADGFKQHVDTIGNVQLPNNFMLTNDHKTNQIVAVGRLLGKLYILDENSFKTVTINSSLNFFQEQGLNARTLDTALGMCEICPLAKQSRLPFSLCDKQAAEIFDLVNMDIWGPYNQPSLSHCTYMLTLVDDHSRSTWTYLMKYKSQAVSVLKAFHRMIFTQFGKRIKTIRSDNGTEFLSLECQNFMIEEGIVHQRTCTHTPQQNGIIEIKHKHLLQIARALMFQSNMPAMFWSEALLTATYIINRLPTQVLNWKSPFEVLRKRTPEYTHMRVFGSLCFATNVQPHKRKFDYRSIKAVFLGYATGQKGYRLYDFNTHSLIVSRDVVFHEDVFPYAQKQLDPVTCTLPINLDDVDHLSSKTQGLEEDNHDTVSEELHVTPQEPEACTEPVIRRSSRVTTKPAWMQDFYCTHFDDPVPHITSFSPLHTYFLTSLTNLQEPRSYKQAYQLPEWRKAMQTELDALLKNDTWDVTALPTGKKPIGCRWIYKLKLKADGSIDKYKARLVAKDEELYMQPPEGYSVPEGHVCKLKRSLYGLKQASRQWNVEFTSKIEGLGFLQSPHDHCLFTKSTATGMTQSKPASTPLPAGIKFTSEAGHLLPNPKSYRRLIGRILYLGFTRPDISHAVQQLSQFMQHPCQQHWDAAHHLLRYLKAGADTSFLNFELVLDTAPDPFAKPTAPTETSPVESEEDLDRILGETDAEVRDVIGHIKGGAIEEKVPHESLPKPMMEDVPGPSGEVQVQKKDADVGEKAPVVGPGTCSADVPGLGRLSCIIRCPRSRTLIENQLMPSVWDIHKELAGVHGLGLFIGQKYPARSALLANVQVPMWDPQHPLCISLCTCKTSSWDRHRSKGCVKDFLYNIPHCVRKWMARVFILAASHLFPERCPSSIHRIMDVGQSLSFNEMTWILSETRG